RVGLDLFEGDNLIKPVNGLQLEVRSVFPEAEFGEQALHADAGPTLRPDQVAAYWLGYAGERNELVQRLEAPNLLERQCHRAIDKAANFQSPLLLADVGNHGVDVDAIM